MESTVGVEELCSRLAEIKEVFIPRKQPENDQEKEKEELLSSNEKSLELQRLFGQNPVKFLQRYHEFIKLPEISCFNSLPNSEEVSFYIKRICHKQDMLSRSQLDCHYISHEVKNRRYRALQKMIEDGEYFCEEEMKKRCPNLYEYYIGRFLTEEEKEEKLRSRAAAHPTSLSGFFMDVIECKNEREETESAQAEEEEFDDDSDEEQEKGKNDALAISDAEKKYMAEEFRSRMYQHFLDGLDKNFSYDSVDDDTGNDDLAQIGQDVEDEYFDEEEPSGDRVSDSKKMQSEEREEEDELDKYMMTLKEDMCGKDSCKTENVTSAEAGTNQA